jgi:hypothetical protein
MSATAKIWRTPLGPRLISLCTVIAAGGVAIFLIGAAIVVLPLAWALAVFVIAPIACFVAALAGYGWRDLAGKWGLQVALSAHSVTLDLPRGRSLIHRPPPQHLTIPYADIVAIESRLEAYRGLGMTMMQRAYVLRRRNGEMVFLFEDRALATAIETSLYANIADDLANRAGVPITDLGMVEGGGGVLGVWGTHSVDWAAPSLPLARQLRLWRHAALTGSLAFVVTMLALVIRLIAGAS